jgi:hypothetical protein
LTLLFAYFLKSLFKVAIWHVVLVSV